MNLTNINLTNTTLMSIWQLIKNVCYAYILTILIILALVYIKNNKTRNIINGFINGLFNRLFGKSNKNTMR